MRLRFWGKPRRIEQPKDIRSALSQLAKFLEECDQDTEKLRQETAGLGRFQITVVRHELNIGKLLRSGVFLVCVVAFLAVGFVAGWYWSPVSQAKLGTEVDVSQARLGIETVEESEAAMVPTLLLPVVSPATGKDSTVQHSSPDTLLQKVRDLLERVKKGE